MKKNSIIIFSGFVLVVLLISGCGTVSGAVEGAKKDYQSVKTADEWMRKNLW